MRVNGKKQRLDYNCSAGVSGSFTTIQQMSLFKRNPLAAISENTENNINVKCKSTNDSNATHLELECHEELNISTDHDPVEYARCKKYWRVYFQTTDSNNLVDIFNQIYSSEARLCNLNLYLSKSETIQPSMRCTLIDWMSDVAHSYRYSPETLFMAVNYIDRFLSISLIELCQLQLIGTACLFISSKLNNTNIPQIEDFVFITDNIYSPSDIISAEKLVLSLLEFDLVVPTILFFAELYVSYFRNFLMKEKNMLLIESLCEYILLDYTLTNSYYPSVLAAAIIIASAYKCGKKFKVQNFEIFDLDLSAISNCYYSLNDFLVSTENEFCEKSTERFMTFWLN